MNGLYIALAVVIFLVLSAFVPSIGKVEPSYIIDWGTVFSALWMFIIPVVVGYSIGRSED